MKHQDLEFNRLRDLQSSKETHNPVEAISKLKNILNEEPINKNETWDLLYDNQIFPHENPKYEFENRIRKIEILNEPKYFISNEKSQTKLKNDLISPIEQIKIDLNQNLKIKYISALSEVNGRIELLKKNLKKQEEVWSVIFRLK